MTVNKTLLITLPSRGRPENVRTTLQSWKDTATNKSNSIVNVLCDDDDPLVKQYMQVIDAESGNYHYCLSVNTRIRMIPTVNAAFKDFPKMDYYCFVGDDHKFRTKGWDTEAIRALEEKTGGWGIWYGDDLNQGENLPTAGVISGKLARVMGFIALPTLVHLHMDSFWKRLGDDLGILIYDPNFIIEHMHYTVGKSEVDEQYLEVNSSEMYENDGREFNLWYDSPDRIALYEKIQTLRAA